jgi:phage tail tape-measure protein
VPADPGGAVGVVVVPVVVVVVVVGSEIGMVGTEIVGQDRGSTTHSSSGAAEDEVALAARAPAANTAAIAQAQLIG